MIVKLSEKEYRVLKRVLKESKIGRRRARVDISTLVADFEDYVASKKLRITNDEAFTDACNDFFRENDMESLVDSEVVEEMYEFIMCVHAMV